METDKQLPSEEAKAVIASLIYRRDPEDFFTDGDQLNPDRFFDSIERIWEENMVDRGIVGEEEFRRLTNRLMRVQEALTWLHYKLPNDYSIFAN